MALKSWIMNQSLVSQTGLATPRPCQHGGAQRSGGQRGSIVSEGLEGRTRQCPGSRQHPLLMEGGGPGQASCVVWMLLTGAGLATWPKLLVVFFNEKPKIKAENKGRREGKESIYSLFFFQEIIYFPILDPFLFYHMLRWCHFYHLSVAWVILRRFKFVLLYPTPGNPSPLLCCDRWRHCFPSRFFSGWFSSWN